jgi:hypothetical protein
MIELSLEKQEKLRVLKRTQQRRDEAKASVEKLESQLANERAWLAMLEREVEELSNGI